MSRPRALGAWAAGLLALAATLTAPALARADHAAAAEADRLFREGRQAAEEGKYGEACHDFEESFRLDPAVGTLLNLGDCEENQGDLQRAFDYYRTAISRMAPNDDRLTHARERLERIRGHAARLEVHLLSTAPEGAVVTLDGATLDPKKGPIYLAKGAHQILVTAVGYRGARYHVGFAEGETKRLDVDAGDALEEVLPNQPHPAARHASPVLRVAGVVSIGVGVASLWAGSLTGVLAVDRKDTQSHNCSASNVCNAIGYDAAQSGAAWAAASTATFIAGALLIGAGATLFVVGSIKHPAPRVAVSFSPAGVVARGRF